MGAVVVDTHAAAWYLLDSASLSPKAGAVLDETAQTGTRSMSPRYHWWRSFTSLKKENCPNWRLNDSGVCSLNLTQAS